MNLVKKGFTLIELLVVIAIIGILAAIILPVYAQAKKSAYRSADMSNMNQLRTALGLYRVDQGGMPPALLGYVTMYTDSPTDSMTGPFDGQASHVADIIPANQLQAALYPKSVNSLATFQPALDRPLSPINSTYAQPYWPNGPVGTGDGSQAYGPTSLVERCPYFSSSDTPTMIPSYYYQVSGYDAATVTTPAGTRFELHYAPFWSYDAVPNTCDGTTGLGSATDSPRQLGYTDPPDSTVVTWDSYFRDYEGGAPLHQKQDIVLFLAGDARPYDSANVAANSWQVTP